MATKAGERRANTTYPITHIINTLVTYKPGYMIKAAPDPLRGSVLVVVQAWEISSRDENEIVGVMFQDEFMVPDPKLGYDHVVEYLEMWLQRFFYEFERHEADEWFKIGGRLVNDPHRDPSEDGG